MKLSLTEVSFSWLNENLFLLKWHNKSFSMVQFIPQIPHNFNFSRTLSESLVIALVTAFSWNSEVTFLLVSII